MSSPDYKLGPQDDPLRKHSFDGIHEFDKKMPNWWLMTFYGSIVFAVGYWFYYYHSGLPQTDQQKIDAHMSMVEAAKLAASASVDDASLWQMSRNPSFIEAGKATFNANCASCHLTSLRGKEESPMAVGPSLADTTWIHGGNPMALNKVVNDGVLAKGMPSWGPVLGQKRINEVLAYVLSYHKEGEPVTIEGAK